MTTVSDDVESPRLSTVLVEVSLLLLALSALALTSTGEARANRLATDAVAVLSGGLLVRAVEHATGRRYGLPGWSLAVRGARRAAVRVRSVPWRRLAADAGRRGRRLLADARARLDGWERSAVVEPLHRQDAFARADLRETVRLAIPLTFAGGLTVLLWWWTDPATVPSRGFVEAWLLVLAVLLVVHAALVVDGWRSRAG